MRVVSVVPYSAGDQCASVTVSDGHYSCVTFCHPCEIEEGAELVEPLQVFDDTGLMVSEQSTPSLKSTGDSTGFPYSYSGVARVVDVTEQLLAVGGLMLQISGYMPGGISNGDMVEFECMRIDFPYLPRHK